VGRSEILKTPNTEASAMNSPLRRWTGLVVGLALLASFSVANATTYYVSNAGSNSNNGRSEGAAFETVAKAAGVVSTGDTILLQRGDVFRESVSISRSGVNVDAYGTHQDLPVISGSTAITNWQQYSGSIYSADLTADVDYLFSDNQQMTIARYPNSGWLRTTTWTEDSDGSNTVVTSTGSSGITNNPRNADDYWNGANMRWHRHSWWFETRKVNDYDASGDLYLDGQSIIPVQPASKAGWGFYMDNTLSELDAPGEYYVDRTADKVYFYAPDGTDPNSLLVEGSTRSVGLTVSGSTVRNVAFRHQQDYGLQITGQTTVEDCIFEGIGSEDGGAALRATWGVKNAHVSNNVFANNTNTAINWNESPYSGGTSYIDHNVLLETGTVDGYGGEGAWKAAGIVVSNATNLHIEHNRIDGTGYAGIILGSDGNFAEYNVIDNAMSTLNDGAAIYTNCSYSTIRNNIIRDTKGGMESSGWWATLAHGIWPEFLNDFHDNVIEGNTVIGSGGYGLFLVNNFDNTVVDNVLYDNERGQINLDGRMTNSGTGRTENLPQNHYFEGNVLYSTKAGQPSIEFDTRYDYGEMQYNYFCNPFSLLLFDETDGSPLLEIEEWQALYSWADPHAMTDVEKLDHVPDEENPVGRSEIFVNDSDVLRSYALEGIWLGVDGSRHEGSVEVAPFSSIILILGGLENGDFNADGMINALDLDLMMAHVNAGSANCLYDLTGDGVVDKSDADAMVHDMLGTEYGDANLDGLVSDADYTVWADSYGQATGWAGGDFNGTGVATEADYTIWADYYGFGASQADVPEPCALGLLALGAGVVGRRGARRRPGSCLAA
jgi:parallel beta-helix repeat protein